MVWLAGTPRKKDNLKILLVRGDPVQLPDQRQISAFLGTQLWSKRDTHARQLASKASWVRILTVKNCTEYIVSIMHEYFYFASDTLCRFYKSTPVTCSMQAPSSLKNEPL